MKVRIKETGEILEVAEYAKIAMVVTSAIWLTFAKKRRCIVILALL